VRDLSVIVLAYETRELVLSCLGALEKELENCRVERGIESQVVVVDNGSKDGSASAIRAAFPMVDLIALAENRGFAAGMNAGIERAKGRVLLLLNSDASPVPGAIAECLRAFDGRPDAWVVGPQLRFPDGRRQNSVHALPSVMSELLPSWLRRRPDGARASPRQAAADAVIEVEAVRGAALFLRREVIDALGPLDEDYFFFLEETDLCWRVHQAGGLVLFVPSADFVHLSGASSKRVDPVATRIEFHRSLYHFARLHRGPLAARMIIGARVVRAVGTALLLLPLAVFSPRQRGRLAERIALLRWHWQGCGDEAGLGRAARAGRPRGSSLGAVGGGRPAR